MKKISTYYFIALAILNGLLTLPMLRFTRHMARSFEIIAEGQRLPLATEWFIACPWWPSIFASFFVLAAGVSVWSRLKSAMLCHAVIFALLSEALVLLLGMLAFAMTFSQLVIPLQ